MKLGMVMACIKIQPFLMLTALFPGGGALRILIGMMCRGKVERENGGLRGTDIGHSGTDFCRDGGGGGTGVSGTRSL